MGGLRYGAKINVTKIQRPTNFINDLFRLRHRLYALRRIFTSSGINPTGARLLHLLLLKHSIRLRRLRGSPKPLGSIQSQRGNYVGSLVYYSICSYGALYFPDEFLRTEIKYH